MKLRILILLLFSMVSVSAKGEEECINKAFSFDENIPKNEQFYFTDEDKGLPKRGDFHLISYYLMSNGCGYRSALVTVKNASPGSTTLVGEHLVALTVNGSKIKSDVRRKIPGLTTESFTVGFGKVSAPIIALLMEEG